MKKRSTSDFFGVVLVKHYTKVLLITFGYIINNMIYNPTIFDNVYNTYLLKSKKKVVVLNDKLCFKV